MKTVMIIPGSMTSTRLPEKVMKDQYTGENITMNWRNLQLNFPKTIEQSDEELRLLIAGKLYENDTLTSGQSAELDGLSKREFIGASGNYLRSC